MLEKRGVKTHFIEKLNDRDQLCHKVEIVPLEIIVRNIIAGSMAKRLGIEEGTIPATWYMNYAIKMMLWGSVNQ